MTDPRRELIERAQEAVANWFGEEIGYPGPARSDVSIIAFLCDESSHDGDFTEHFRQQVEQWLEARDGSR